MPHLPSQVFRKSADMVSRDQNAIKECFTLFDKDADGQISSHELGTVVRSLGLNPTEAEVEEINRNMIKKNSFSLSDLMQVMTRFADDPRNKEEEIKEAFRVFDRDNTGFISAAELKHVLTNIGEKLSDKEVDELIREIDVDRNGQVNYEDVVRLMCG